MDTFYAGHLKSAYARAVNEYTGTNGAVTDAGVYNGAICVCVSVVRCESGTGPWALSIHTTSTATTAAPDRALRRHRHRSHGPHHE